MTTTIKKIISTPGGDIEIVVSEGNAIFAAQEVKAAEEGLFPPLFVPSVPEYPETESHDIQDFDPAHIESHPGQPPHYHQQECVEMTTTTSINAIYV